MGVSEIPLVSCNELLWQLFPQSALAVQVLLALKVKTALQANVVSRVKLVNREKSVEKGLPALKDTVAISETKENVDQEAKEAVRSVASKVEEVQLVNLVFLVEVSKVRREKRVHPVRKDQTVCEVLKELKVVLVSVLLQFAVVRNIHCHQNLLPFLMKLKIQPAKIFPDQVQIKQQQNLILQDPMILTSIMVPKTTTTSLQS